jgi:putative toxin-antitoxin system antitoxin component (TIGR02293 family)
MSLFIRQMAESRIGGDMSLSQVAEMLGGRKVLGQDIRTELDLIDLSRTGVSKAALLRLAEYMGSPISRMADLLPVTERTIQRYQPQMHFNLVVSESILHLAEVIARGVEVFEDKESFFGWLSQPCVALGGQSPRSLLSSRFGADMVLDELTRMEHGVVS